MCIRDRSNNDQFQRSLHFIEVISKELDIKKEDVYVNTSAATDGAVSYTHLDVYKRQPLEVEKRVMDVLPKSEWLAAHQAMIYFGRAICHPKNPECDQYPQLYHFD